MNSEVDWCFYFTQSVGHQTFNCCYVAIDARGWGFWQSESWFASVPITIVGECWWHFSLGKNSLQCSSMYCDVEICISFFLPATQKTLNVNPRLINPKRLFNWEGTIKKYQIIKSWLLGESPPNKPWLVDSVLTLVLVIPMMLAYPAPRIWSTLTPMPGGTSVVRRIQQSGRFWKIVSNVSKVYSLLAIF